ncbi:MAG: sigma 54-interacting transcriptional regulator [Polyangiaceae bacterium]
MSSESEQRTASYAWAAAEAAGQKPRLLVMWGEHVIARTLERGTVLTLGRSSEASLQVDHASVSRLHAELRIDDLISIRDLGSSNGLRIAGQVLEQGQSHEMHPGQLVAMGAATLVVQPTAIEIRDPGASPTAPSPWPATGPMAEVARLLRLVAPGNVSVLLTGETGVGKEVAAEFVHRCSRRAEGPFIRVNCAALPESLIESEMFGYERGAFTGATGAKPGLFELADGGSLFLDEVGDLPLAVQGKLLRALDLGETQRLGATSTRRVDVRVVSATNRPLAEDVAAGRFRQDLFFRLAAMPVELPPLRHRREEVPGLTRLFLGLAARAAGLPEPPLSESCVRALRTHDFPGNVRELRNMVDRALLLANGGSLAPEHFLLSPQGRPTATDLKSVVKQAERARIEEALRACDGNQTRAAKQLGIGRRTLIDKMHEFGLRRSGR